MKEAFIYDAIRTPRGKAKADGSLADLSPFALLKMTLLKRAQVSTKVGCKMLFLGV